MTRSNATHNLQQAFNTAEQSLGLTKLLDPEGNKRQVLLKKNLRKFLHCEPLNIIFRLNPDVNTENPDEKSIITYVVSYYHYFSKMKALIVEGKRIGKVSGVLHTLIGINITFDIILLRKKIQMRSTSRTIGGSPLDLLDVWPEV